MAFQPYEIEDWDDDCFQCGSPRIREENGREIPVGIKHCIEFYSELGEVTYRYTLHYTAGVLHSFVVSDPIKSRNYEYFN